ncbi:MAG: hypothetical protein WA019_03545 [Candidatus Moraniibacteriota bacterium]
MRYAVLRDKYTHQVVNVTPFESLSDLGGSGFDGSKFYVSYEDSDPQVTDPVLRRLTRKCMWCGKTFQDHMDKPLPNATPRVPCLLLKSGFVARKEVTR